MYISIDIGGTNTRIGISNAVELVNFEKRFAFVNTHDYETDFHNVVDTINRNADDIKAIGIGIPGDISGDKRKVYDANHNSEWANKPFVAELEKQFNCPVYLDNDAQVAALGVAYYDKQKAWDEFVYITWGTGVGGALVKPSGNRYDSVKINWEKYFVQWENDCGGKALEKRFGKPASQLNDNQWQEIFIKFRQYIFDLAEELNIGTVVLGGGITAKQKNRISQIHIIGVSIYATTLGEDIGLYGGLGLIRSNQYRYKYIK